MSFKWLKRHVTLGQYKSPGATEVAIPDHPSLPRDTQSPAVECPGHFSASPDGREDHNRTSGEFSGHWSDLP